MDDATLLEMVKQNLEIMHQQKDNYLKALIKAAKNFIAREGVTLAPESDNEDAHLIVMYAAWLYRKRANDEAAMPRMLRYTLNNRLLHKERDTNAIG